MDRVKSRSARSLEQPPGRAARRLIRTGFPCWIVSLLMLLPYAYAAGETQYRYEAWTAESGLPQNIIRGLAQTPDGYLWITTFDGLARFDGVRFTVFNKSNTREIKSNLFSSMVNGQDGDLWMSNESYGLTRYHQGGFHAYGAEDGLPTKSVRGLAGDDAGDVWILSEDNILRWNKATGEFLDITPEQLRIHYEPLQWDNAGFWGLDKLGLHIFTHGRFTGYALPEWLPGRLLWSVGVDGDGSIWLETLDGKQAVIPAGRSSAEPVDPANPPLLAYPATRNHSWTIHVNRRLSRTIDFVSSGQATSIPLTRLLEDREGNLWIGTEGSGLYRLQEQSINIYSKAEGLLDSDIYPVYQARDGAVWLGAWQLGLSRFADGKFTNYTVAQGMSGRLVSAIAEDRNGNLWVGMRNTLGILRNGRFHKPTGIVLPDRAVVQAIIQDRGGTIWVGTSNGLVLYRDGPVKTLTMQDGLATNDVRVILESANGDIWIGGYGGLTRFHQGQFTRWTEREGLPSDNVRSIYQDREGVLWVGTYDGGLGRIRDGKFTRYTESDGLFNNGVFQILEDERGSLWMSSNRGIYRVSKRELNDFADGKLNAITSVAYGKADGMLNVECNGGLWPSGVETRDGKLWFPTQEGVAVIDPETVRTNPLPPPVVIEGVLLDHASMPLGGPLTIAPGKQNLGIDYTALSFIHSEQIRFRYKLEGLDSSWIDAGSRRTAYYSHLPPGTYQFHVIARNSDGVWNEAGQSLTIDVLAPFYRTVWFMAIEAGTLAVVIVCIVRYRFAQLERAQASQRAFSQQLIASQENERQRIAADLHDSLGQRLVVINNLALFSLRAQRRNGAAETEASTLEEISAEAASAIRETREISYNLRPFQLDRLGLTKAVESILRTAASSSGVHITSQIENIDDVFDEDLQINFYRIVQEAMSNMMKHAQATEAEVRIVRDHEQVLLYIRDNGKGFSPGNTPIAGAKNGFGLTGMSERAHLLGGELRVRSAPEEGTETTVAFKPWTRSRNSSR